MIVTDCSSEGFLESINFQPLLTLPASQTIGNESWGITSSFPVSPRDSRVQHMRSLWRCGGSLMTLVFIWNLFVIHSRWHSIPKVFGYCWLGKALCLTLWSASPGHRILVNKSNRFYFQRLKLQVSRLFSEQLSLGLLCSVLLFSSIWALMIVFYKRGRIVRKTSNRDATASVHPPSKAEPSRLLFITDNSCSVFLAKRAALAPWSPERLAAGQEKENEGNLAFQCFTQGSANPLSSLVLIVSGEGVLSISLESSPLKTCL